MSLPEKAAYLRGLYDGMELNAEKSKEAKLLKAVIDVIEELANHVAENEESINSLADQADDMGILLEELEDSAFPGGIDEEPMDEDAFDDEEEEDYVTTFEVECPNCEELLTIDEEHLAAGEVECPSCGQRFQIELEFENDDAAEEDEIPF